MLALYTDTTFIVAEIIWFITVVVAYVYIYLIIPGSWHTLAPWTSPISKCITCTCERVHPEVSVLTC
jgi:hypothetical protein